MASPPPPYQEMSVSRSRSKQQGLTTLADDLLRNPTARTSSALGSSRMSNITNMASPPSYHEQSVTRSQSQRESLSRQAEVLLRNPTAHTPSSASSLASVTKKIVSKKDIRSTTDELLRHTTPQAGESSSVSSETLTSRVNPRVSGSRPPVVGSSPSTVMPASRRKPDVAQNRSSSPHPITVAESKRRVRQMQSAVYATNAKTPRRDTRGTFKAVCSTDVLFLIDTTSSMGPYLEAAKDQVRSIMDSIKEAFLGECVVRVAVVGYKDHCNEPKNIEFLDFTTSIDEARGFLSSLKPIGGEGWTADALGGILQASKASWMHPSRCIIHIADAPGHSRALHDMPERQDNKYYQPGSEPHGLTFEPVIQQLIGLDINFTFLQIHSTTDRMVKAFVQTYQVAGADVQMLESNQYYAVTNANMVVKNPKACSSTSPRLLFQELRLGVDTAVLKLLVLKTVTDTVTRTSNRHSLLFNKGVSSTASSQGFAKSFSFNAMLSAVNEANAEATEVKLDTSPPRWDAPDWLDQTWQLGGYCPDVIIYSHSTLQDMMESNDNIKLSFAQWTIHARSKPFGQGAQRLASYARMVGSASKFVVKTHTEGGKKMAFLIEDMCVQALCKAFALEFNGLVRLDQSIDFLITACLESDDRELAEDKKDHMSLEQYLPGEYVKYNNNALFVREDTPEDDFNRVAQAFSHFTFERSWGHFMVVDLQGAGNLLTDPAVHTKDPDRLKLNDTNLHSDGFKMFFANHFCNDVCRQLGLVSNRSMAIDGKYTFRKQWPAMEPTVCCSNKLCQKIIRLDQSRSSPKFPGYSWCPDCWPQLDSTLEQWICAAPGDTHQYDMSRFFYTSQGKLPPRRCPEHSEKDVTANSTAAMGGRLWTQMKLGSKRSVVLGNEY